MIYSPQQLANQLKLFRTKQKLTQAELAQRVGLKQATISSFENRPETTQLKTVFKIIQAIGVKMDITAKGETLPEQTDEESW
ncbi:type II toxin-antitoxin system antitoxin HipB [Enterovibrio norvegicus]|uniref:type II toxin-antitoxin system antitoxin HipB n=1 Tax=Enterovibrio norvegicus TaxID=188144 RepID=UPI0024B1CC87|nr:type II toxin-antitoxin system antitoxin HipB [Enterovibrio norvegicus]